MILWRLLKIAPLLVLLGANLIIIAMLSAFVDVTNISFDDRGLLTTKDMLICLGAGFGFVLAGAAIMFWYDWKYA